MDDVQARDAKVAPDGLTPRPPLPPEESAALPTFGPVSEGETGAGAASDAPTGPAPTAVVGAGLAPPAPDVTATPNAVPAPDAAPAPDAPSTSDAAPPEPASETHAPRPDSLAPSDELEELTLPSLVQAPAILPPGTSIGPEGRLVVAEHLGCRGRVNRYRAALRPESGQEMSGQEIEVELRHGPADDPALQREAEILTGVQYAMLPKAF